MGHPDWSAHAHDGGGLDLGLGLLVGTAAALILAGGLHIASKREVARVNGSLCPFGFARVAPGSVSRCITERQAQNIAESCYQADHGHEVAALECGESPAEHERHGADGDCRLGVGVEGGAERVSR